MVMMTPGSVVVQRILNNVLEIWLVICDMR